MFAFVLLAMVSISRQRAFRWSALGHAAFVALLLYWGQLAPTLERLQFISYALVGAGMVQGAILIGWRLAQIPKSQALEFLLTSPLHPGRVFLGEALAGWLRFLLVQSTGWPLLWVLSLYTRQTIVEVTLWAILPIIYGSLVGFGLTVWAYECRWLRRLGEGCALLGILVYLIVGVIAGERLIHWVNDLPDLYYKPISASLFFVRDFNPFGVVQYWFSGPFRDTPVAFNRILWCAALGATIALFALIRGATRLKGHFQDRHYTPMTTNRATQTERIGNTPLTWWAVRRVMEYSGRINIYLAGGFALVYSAHLLAGDHWPAWAGQSVFLIFERLGGAPMLVTGLVVLAGVPAAFQYGLWDSSAQDRCRRLELLLLTELESRDYWNASLAAAWARGRGYCGIAVMVLLALLLAQSISISQFTLAIVSAAILWFLYFTIGFARFSKGTESNGIGSILVLGLPIVTVLLSSLPAGVVALLPPGAVWSALKHPTHWTMLFGPILQLAFTLYLARRVQGDCVPSLRTWYSNNQGLKADLA